MLADAPVSDPTSQTILIPHRDDVRLEDVDAFADHLVLGYRREALTRLAIWPLDDGRLRRAARSSTSTRNCSAVGLGRQSGMAAADAADRRSPRSSRPAQVYDYVLADRRARCCARATRCSATSTPATTSSNATGPSPRTARGSRSRSSGARTNGVDGPPPLLLYGYGSYEASIDPGFSVSRLSLLDRGMVFVVAHVRGGGEMGRHWYENGKTLTKKNTFTDFVACARHLIDTGRHHAGPDGRRRRQRGRPADGRGGQPGTRTVRRHPGQRARSWTR